MELLKVSETAQMLNVCDKGVWRLLRRGELPRVKVGRSTRIPLSAIEAYIERGGSS